MFTHTLLKFDTQDLVTHEVDFKDNEDKLANILRANYNNEVIKVQVKIGERVYDLLNTDLYF